MISHYMGFCIVLVWRVSCRVAALAIRAKLPTFVSSDNTCHAQTHDNTDDREAASSTAGTQRPRHRPAGRWVAVEGNQGRRDCASSPLLRWNGL